jgi:hypothetical protein
MLFMLSVLLGLDRAASDLAPAVATHITIEKSGRLLECAKLLLTHAMPTIDLTDEEQAALA